jgi:hypothetical protein
LDSSAIRDWLAALGGSGSDNLDIFPKILHGIVRIPGLCEFVLISFEVREGQGAIGGSQMGDDVGYTDVHVSKGVIFKILILDGVDGRKHFLVELFSKF